MEFRRFAFRERKLGNVIDAKLSNFLNILKITDISNIVITSLQTTNVIYVHTNTECVQYDVKFSMPLNFCVDFKITYPRREVINDHTEIGKLRIHVSNSDLRHEIISCTNYLQRQKNVHLALSIIKRCASITSERKLILDMLVLHSEGFITYSVHEEGGIYIECVNPNTEFKYFSSHWTVQFDCINNLVTDYIDFSITLLDREFYDTVKPIMNSLIAPSLMYNIKVELWWQIIYAISESVTQEVLGRRKTTPASTESDDADFSTVRSVQHIKPYKYEICDSDEEDCVIVNNN